MAESVQKLLKRYEQLAAIRSNVVNTWQDIADYVIPYKGNIVVQREEGATQTDKLFDATAPHALMLLGSSLNQGMTPATQPWLSLKMRQDELNEIKEVQDWLEDCAERMHKAFRQSKFQQCVHELYLDLAAFGTAALFVDERPPTSAGAFGGFRFVVPAAGTFVIAENADGEVDTCFRTLSLTLAAMYARWGDTIGQELLDKLEQKPYEMVTVLHAVYPRTTRRYDPRTGQPRGGAKNMAWTSCYLAPAQKIKLEESGYQEFPFMVPRWAKTSGELYGRGPSHTALPDVASLNAAKEFILKAAPLAMQPPTVERDDSVVGDPDLTPGGRNVVSGSGPLGDQFGFLDTRARVDMSQLVLAELRQGIHAIYFTDQLILHEKPNMTATEVMALQEQMQRLLGPTAGRLESEFLNPLVQRCFAVMARANAFKPLPEPLLQLVAGDEADLDIEYEGPLARAQRTIELSAQDRLVNFVLAVTQGKTQFPAPEWDVLKTDKMIRDRAEITGLPSDNLESDEEIERLREERNRAQQQATQVEQMTKIAEAAGKASPMLQEMTGAPPNGSAR